MSVLPLPAIQYVQPSHYLRQSFKVDILQYLLSQLLLKNQQHAIVKIRQKERMENEYLSIIEMSNLKFQAKSGNIKKSNIKCSTKFNLNHRSSIQQFLGEEKENCPSSIPVRRVFRDFTNFRIDTKQQSPILVSQKKKCFPGTFKQEILFGLLAVLSKNISMKKVYSFLSIKNHIFPNLPTSREQNKIILERSLDLLRENIDKDQQITMLYEQLETKVQENEELEEELLELKKEMKFNIFRIIEEKFRKSFRSCLSYLRKVDLDKSQFNLGEISAIQPQNSKQHKKALIYLDDSDIFDIRQERPSYDFSEAIESFKNIIERQTTMTSQKLIIE